MSDLDLSRYVGKCHEISQMRSKSRVLGERRTLRSAAH